MTTEEWLTKSEKILRDVKEWRKDHCKATFVEREAEVHLQKSPFRHRLGGIWQ